MLLNRAKKFNIDAQIFKILLIFKIFTFKFNLSLIKNI